MPASVSLRTWAATRLPPSNLTACAPPSLSMRTAVKKACSGEDSYDPNGRSATTNARLQAALTARTAGISSSTVTGSVESAPSIVLPIESPMSSMSMPASSKMRAVG